MDRMYFSPRGEFEVNGRIMYVAGEGERHELEMVSFVFYRNEQSSYGKKSYN